MNYTKIDPNVLPSYAIEEEIFNTASHILGFLIGLSTLILSVMFHHNYYGFVSGIIFGFSLIVLYGMSSTYHGLPLKKLRAKKIFQVLDHCSIFVLIAGSFTPFALCVLRDYNSKLGWIFYIGIWSIAVIGIILNVVDLNKYKIFSMVCYLLMGSSIFVRVDVLHKMLGNAGLTLLISGGLAYLIGFVFYAMGKRHKWLHSVFHVFCIAGSVLHCICVIIYVL